MARNATRERVSAEDLESGDSVTVYVNNRAAKHLGTTVFDATVNYVGALGDTVQFEPEESLQDICEMHTWYSDKGYIHGYHDGVGGHSDVGKVRKVER